MRKAEAFARENQHIRTMDSANMRIALLKKPLLSLFAYEVSCRVRVEKTTLYSAIPEGTASFIHPNNLVPPLLSWIRLYI